MTVRVTTLKGALAGAYYTEELGGYYLDAGEPAGKWWGSGADVEYQRVSRREPQLADVKGHV